MFSILPRDLADDARRRKRSLPCADRSRGHRACQAMHVERCVKRLPDGIPPGHRDGHSALNRRATSQGNRGDSHRSCSLAFALGFLAVCGRPTGNGRRRRPTSDSTLLMKLSLPKGRPVRVRSRIMPNRLPSSGRISASRHCAGSAIAPQNSLSIRPAPGLTTLAMRGMLVSYPDFTARSRQK